MQSQVVISLSSDRSGGFELLSEGLHRCDSGLSIKRESLLDLLLKDQLSWFVGGSDTQMIISAYFDYFRDLKIIADLRKRPKYQWTPIFLLVKEDIANTRQKFLQFGVTGVFNHPTTEDGLHLLIRKILAHINISCAPGPGGSREPEGDSTPHLIPGTALVNH